MTNGRGYQTQPSGAATIDPGTWAQRKQQLRHDFSAMQRDADEAVLLAPFEQVRRQALTDLPMKVRDLHGQGYRFTQAIGDEIAALAPQIEALEAPVRRTVRARSLDLGWRVDALRRAVADLDLAFTPDPYHLTRLDREVAGVRAEIGSITRWLTGQLGTIPAAVRRIEGRIQRALQTLRLGREAGFVFRDSEALFIAARAEWHNDADNPDGVLYATDGRVMFERAEREGGFLGIGGHDVREVLWEFPVAEIDGITAEVRGLFGATDLIHFHPKPNATQARITVEVKGGIDAGEFASALAPLFDGAQERPGG